MKVLMINGDPDKNGNISCAFETMALLFHERGIESEIVWIADEGQQGCTACGKCIKLKKCIFEDSGNELIERADEFDGIVIGAPVYYGSVSKGILNYLDRMFRSASDRFAGKPAAGIVSCRRGTDRSVYERFNEYFEMANMPVITSQDGNQIHSPQDLKAVSDTANMMAWLITCICAGKEKGLEEPEKPDRKFTFLR